MSSSAWALWPPWCPTLPLQHRYCIVLIVSKQQERELRSEADCLSKVTAKALIEDHEEPAAPCGGAVLGASRGAEDAGPSVHVIVMVMSGC
jgi:hypothetical protein